MKYPTTEGQTYAIVGTADGTVTSASGVVIASFTANKQAYFTAPVGGYVTISDENAIVTAVFKLAPGALAGTSGGGDTPGGSGEPDGDYIYYDDNGCITQSRLEHITDIRYLQYGRTALQTLTIDAPNVVNAEGLCQGCPNLTSVTGNLPKVKSLLRAFYQCSVAQFNVTGLQELQNAGGFLNGSKIESFNIPVPKMQDCNYGFSGNQELTSVTSDFPSLTNGQYMCSGTINLSIFSGGLPALTAGTGMFGSNANNCSRLDLASVQNIAATINDLASQGKTGTIHIGMDAALRSDDETAEINVALAAIRAKGWTVNELYRA